MMDVTELLGEVDILDYISQYCDFEEKHGEYWALSPLKQENTPSFSVDREKQFFYDFSSGSGGNVIDFIRLHDNVDLAGAFRILKKWAHIQDNQSTGEVTRLNAAKVARRFKKKVTSAKTQNSTVLDSGYMERFEFRKDKLKLWADEGIGWNVMLDYGVRYDAFSDRIVYPIKDYHGNIISVCGRTCDPDYKAHKLRKYTYFQQIGTVDTLYGFSDNRDAILSSQELILFEGAKSVLLAKTWGVGNTAAILTSHLNVNQMKFLIRLGMRVVFALDKDANPLKDDNIKRLLHYVPIEYICDSCNLLDEKMAPVDKGLEVWQKLYNSRRILRRD